jgi:hypothetical protein
MLISPGCRHKRWLQKEEDAYKAKHSTSDPTCACFGLSRAHNSSHSLFFFFYDQTFNDTTLRKHAINEKTIVVDADTHDTTS